jgi:flagellin-like hook-associated protein FlgL
MAMVVKNNMSAISTLNTLNKNQGALAKSLAQVSSGMKINSAKDDASGYAISERMRVMIRSLDQSNENTQNASNLMKVAEDAVAKTVDILDTLKKKAIQAATDTKTDEDRATIQKEINQLVDQIDDQALVTYNGKYLLDGSKSSYGSATYNTWTNQALSEDTSTSTKLTELKARNGEELTIEDEDRIAVSYVKNGKTYYTDAIVSDVKTFEGIFKLAENIDTTTDIFATYAHESIQKLGGTQSIAYSDALDQAIKELRESLAFATTTNTVGSTMSDVSSGTRYIDLATSTTSTEIGNIQTAAGVVDTYKLTTTQTMTGSTYTSSSPNFTEITSATGIVNTSNGELFQAVADALKEYNIATTNLGNLDLASDSSVNTSSSSGLSLQLYNVLHAIDENFTWDGKPASLEHSSTQELINSSSAAQSAYAQYKAALTTKTEAKAALDDAVYNYNEGIAQLDALVKYQNLVSAKESYFNNVEAYLAAARNEMETTTTPNATFVVPATAADNLIPIKYTVGVDDDETKAKKIDQIIDALREKLTSIANNSVTAISGLQTDTTKVVSNSTLSSGFYYSSDGTNASAVVAQSAATSLITAAQKVDAAGTTNIFSNNVLRNLKLAQENVLAEHTGPALLMGSEVGIDPSGKTVTTLDGKVGVTFMAANSGTEGQISGFTISISDSDGNVRKSVNTALNAWSTSVYGKNASTKDNALTFHVGASANQSITVDMADMRAEALGLKGKDGKVVDVSTKENANAAISVFDNALKKALDVQTTIGAIEARLDYTSENLTTASENIQASESTIRDADMAKAMTEYTKNNVLLQAAQSMLAQANQNSSAVLSLLQ